MITPFEIENKEFSKSLRGYNAEEVDLFLDQIILDLEKLLDENEKLKAKIEHLNADLNQYKKSESSVLNTLESAKKLMNDISESAEKRAEIIIRNAKMDAEVITKDAKESVSKLTEESEKLKYKMTRFKERYREILEDELNQLDGSSEDLFADLERDFQPASMTAAIPEFQFRPEPETEAAPTQPAAEAKAAAEPADDYEAVKPRVQRTSDTMNFSAKETTVMERKPSMSDTIVVKEKTLEEMLMEDFGAKSGSDKAKNDLTKTRIL